MSGVFDLIGRADHVEAHLPGIGSIPFLGLVGELDPDISQDRVDPVRNHLQKVFEGHRKVNAAGRVKCDMAA